MLPAGPPPGNLGQAPAANEVNMRATWYSKNGEARDVLVTGELPTPTPAAGEVRVRLATSGVNPSDVKSRRTRPLGSERIVPHSDGASGGGIFFTDPDGIRLEIYAGDGAHDHGAAPYGEAPTCGFF